MAPADTPASPSKPFSFGRLVPLLVLVAGLVVFFALDLQRYISFEVLRENREVLLTWVQQKGILAGLISAQIALRAELRRAVAERRPLPWLPSPSATPAPSPT